MQRCFWLLLFDALNIYNFIFHFSVLVSDSFLNGGRFGFLLFFIAKLGLKKTKLQFHAWKVTVLTSLPLQLSLSSLSLSVYLYMYVCIMILSSHSHSL